MKRLVIGIFVLLLLLGTGLFIAAAVRDMYRPITDLLEEASALSLSGSFPSAREKAEKAKELWERQKNATATVADHTPMEEIDHLFAEAEIYAKTAQIPHFAACCAKLAVMIGNMADAHAPNLWNLL